MAQSNWLKLPLDPITYPLACVHIVGFSAHCRYGSMPLQGGIRQQLKRDDEYIPPVVEPPKKAVRCYATGGRTRSTSIGAFLKSMYIIGRLTSPELQEAAYCQRGDRELSQIADAGNSGLHRQNMHRDVMRTLGKKVCHPQVYIANVAFWDPDKQQQIQQQCDFLLPHEIAEHIASDASVSLTHVGNNAALEARLRTWCEREGCAYDSTIGIGM